MHTPFERHRHVSGTLGRNARHRRTMWNLVGLATAAIAFVGIGIVALSADAAEPPAAAVEMSRQAEADAATVQKALRHALPLGGLVAALAVMAVQLGKPPKG